MPSQNRPASDQHAPDPARSYGRENPNTESGQGRLENNVSTPTNRPDRMPDAAENRQEPRQLNAQDAGSQRASNSPDDVARREQPDHSMKDEEPMGWDQAPTDIHNPRDQRQPRTGGKGGTP